MTTAASSWLRVLPGHLMPLEEYDALPDEVSRRAELVEGVLHVSPSPRVRHQHLARRLADALDTGLAAGWGTLLAVDVLIEGGPAPTVRQPDVVVVRSACLAGDRQRLDPTDVLAVVEVASPGSRRTDRVAKRAEYAEVGIPHYAIVEPGPPVVLTELVLEGGAYRVRGEHRGLARVDLGFATEVDLDGLDRRP